MPWTLITEVGLLLIGWFTRSREKSDQRKKDFINRVKAHNKQVIESASIRDKYADILAEIEKEEKEV